MDKWEYTVIIAREGRVLRRDFKAFPRSEESRLVEYLNLLGEEGWDVAGYQRGDQGIESILLKRPWGSGSNDA